KRLSKGAARHRRQETVTVKSRQQTPLVATAHKKRTWYLQKLSDAKLVKYIRRGNSQAFDVLTKRHEAKLRQIIRAALFDKSWTDDVLQDVWQVVVLQLASPPAPLLQRGVKSRPRYRETGKFYGWLSTMAFRQAMMMNREKLYTSTPLSV